MDQFIFYNSLDGVPSNYMVNKHLRDQIQILNIAPNDLSQPPNNKVSIQSLLPPVYCYKKQTGGFFMSQPIVPLTVPQSRRFEKKSRNDILMKIRLGKVEVTFYLNIMIGE